MHQKSSESRMTLPGIPGSEVRDIDMGAYETGAIVIDVLPPPFIITGWNFDLRNPCLACPDNWTLIFDLQTYSTKGSDPGTRFHWAKPAELIFYDQYAILEGVLADVKDPKAQFYVYLKLENKQNWKEWSKKGGTYYVQSKEASQVASQYHSKWAYWELSPESHMKGMGNIQGYLRLLPGKLTTGFQLGLGGNAMDGDLGLGGQFRYEGEIQYDKKQSYISGSGSFHGDAIEKKK